MRESISILSGYLTRQECLYRALTFLLRFPPFHLCYPTGPSQLLFSAFWRGLRYDDYGSLGQYSLTAVVDRDLYYVTTEADQVDATNDDRWFSLREAVIAANVSTQPAFMRLPQGDYALEHTGTEVGDASFNDLDITGDVRIVGDGAGLTVVDNSGLGPSNHRSFDVTAGGTNLELLLRLGLFGAQRPALDDTT